MREADIIKRVFLLGIFKKEPEETLEEVTKSLVNTGMFDLAEGKRVLEELKKDGYIANEALSMTGVAIAMEAQAEFTLQ